MHVQAIKNANERALKEGTNSTFGRDEVDRPNFELPSNDLDSGIIIL